MPDPYERHGRPGDGQRITDEILSEPGALEEIRSAEAELDRGEYVRGVNAVRALRPRRES